MANVLLMGKEYEAQIAQMIWQASNNIMTDAQVKEYAKKNNTSPASLPEFTKIFEVGFKVAFYYVISNEGVINRMLGVSNMYKEMPSIDNYAQIMKDFMFDGDLHTVKVLKLQVGKTKLDQPRFAIMAWEAVSEEQSKTLQALESFNNRQMTNCNGQKTTDN